MKMSLRAEGEAISENQLPMINKIASSLSLLAMTKTKTQEKKLWTN